MNESIVGCTDTASDVKPRGACPSILIPGFEQPKVVERELTWWRLLRKDLGEVGADGRDFIASIGCANIAGHAVSSCVDGRDYALPCIFGRRSAGHRCMHRAKQGCEVRFHRI